MFILVINAGSSSLKCALIDTREEKVHIRGSIHNIGIAGTSFWYECDGKQQEKNPVVSTHREALVEVLDVIRHHIDLKAIAAVGHRVVQGGNHYIKPTIINEETLKAINELSAIAPLHNPHNLEGIFSCQQLLPNIPHVAVFDTAFHQTMEPQQYLYAIPMSYYKQYGIRKYGFHGISHSYVNSAALKYVTKKKPKMISCHLGAGCSVCATQDCKSFDTSMGFSPMQGLVMGTRSGDIDPELVVYLQKNTGLSPDHVVHMLNNESGIKGIAGTADMQEVIKRTQKKDKSAMLALDVFVNRLVFYIGGYAAELDGMDALIFTGGIGENEAIVRKMVCNNLKHLGIVIDDAKNNAATDKSITVMSKPSSSAKVLVIPTHEELIIAKDVAAILRGHVHGQ